MFHKIAIRTCAALLLAVPSIFATDITGKWFGTVQSYDKNESIPGTVRFEFHQMGDRIVGLRINYLGDMDQLHGKITGNRVTFEVAGYSEKFELVLDRDKLRGSVHAEIRDSPVSRDVLITRETSAEGPYTGSWFGKTEGEKPLCECPYGLVLHQSGLQVSGSFLLGETSMNLPAGVVDGSRLKLTRKEDTFDLILQGDKITATVTLRNEYSKLTVYKISFTRRAEMPPPEETWAGTLTYPDGYGESFLLQFDHHKGALVGTFFADSRSPYPIENLAVNGNSVTFDVAIFSHPGLSHFKLTRDGYEIKGQETMLTAENEKTAVLDITAVKRFDESPKPH